MTDTTLDEIWSVAEKVWSKHASDECNDEDVDDCVKAYAIELWKLAFEDKRASGEMNDTE